MSIYGLKTAGDRIPKCLTSEKLQVIYSFIFYSSRVRISRGKKRNLTPGALGAIISRSIVKHISKWLILSVWCEHMGLLSSPLRDSTVSLSLQTLYIFADRLLQRSHGTVFRPQSPNFARYWWGKGSYLRPFASTTTGHLSITSVQGRRNYWTD